MTTDFFFLCGKPERKTECHGPYEGKTVGPSGIMDTDGARGRGVIKNEEWRDQAEGTRKIREEGREGKSHTPVVASD